MEDLINTMWEKIIELATSSGLKLLYAIILIIIGTIIIKFFTKKIDKLTVNEKIDLTVAKFIRSVTRTVLYILLYFSAAMILGVPTTTFVAILGSCGLAIGLALQGSLSNLAGSLMLLIFKPYKVGDFVEVNGVSGTVEEINLFYTILNTPDNKRITCPNGSASNTVVTDYSAKETRRVDFSFTVEYGTNSEKVRKVLLETASTSSLVLMDPAPVVYMTAHNDSSLEFALRVWAKTEDYWAVKFYLMEAVNNAFEKNNIVIPFPQMDVHISNQK